MMQPVSSHAGPRELRPRRLHPPLPTPATCAGARPSGIPSTPQPAVPAFNCSNSPRTHSLIRLKQSRAPPTCPPFEVAGVQLSSLAHSSIHKTPPDLTTPAPYPACGPFLTAARSPNWLRSSCPLCSAALKVCSCCWNWGECASDRSASVVLRFMEWCQQAMQSNSFVVINLYSSGW